MTTPPPADAPQSEREAIPMERAIAQWAGEAARHWWLDLTDEQRAETIKLPPAQLFSLGFQCSRANDSAELASLRAHNAALLSRVAWHEREQTALNAVIRERAEKNERLRTENAALKARVQQGEPLIRRIAQQKPEKPDHYTQCGQCGRNIGDAEEVVDAIDAARAAGVAT